MEDARVDVEGEWTLEGDNKVLAAYNLSKTQVLDIAQKQAAVDRSRSHNSSNSVSSKLKTERQERAKVALTKSSPPEQSVATGPFSYKQYDS